MKIISLGKIDKKFYISLILYIIIFVIVVVVSYFFEKNENNNLTNLELNKIIIFGFCIFFGIPEYINRKSLNKKSSDKRGIKSNKNSITYIFRFKYREIDYKKFLILILFLLLNYICDFGTDIYYRANSHHYKLLLSKDSTNIIYVVYLFIIFRPFQKINFYKHQYLSLLVIIIMELIRYFIGLFIIQKVSFDFPYDLFCLIPLLLFPLFDIIHFYVINWYMKNNYYSPFLICFLIGFINSLLSLIILFCFYFININCGGNKICLSLSEIGILTHWYYIFYYIFESVWYGIVNFLIFAIINYFTIFHLIIIFYFNALFSNLFQLFENFAIFELIMIIITSIFELFAISVFFEIIELNFCGLNLNLKKSIINRANNETITTIEVIEEEEDEDNDINEGKYRDLETINDNNSMY